MKTIKCSNCKLHFEEDDLLKIEGKDYCYSCHENCKHCNKLFIYGNNEYCYYCLEGELIE